MSNHRSPQGLLAMAALLGLPVAGLAQPVPGVQLYGQATAGVTMQNHQAGGSSVKGLGNSQFAASLIGLRGHEDLGGGMSAVFRLEHGLNLDTGSPTATKFWNRQSYVGLNISPMATVTLGRQFHAATDRVIQSLDVYNVGGTSLAVTPLGLFGVNRFANNDSRADDSVKLRLRGPMGLTAGLSAAADDGAGRSQSFDLALVNPGYTVAAYGVKFRAPTQAANGTVPEHQAFGVGGNLKLGPTRLFVHHMASELDPSAVGRVVQKNRITHLGVDWQALPLTSLKLAFYNDRATAMNGVAGRNGSKNTWVASAEYHLSKRSSVHLGWFSNRFSGGYKLDPVNISALGRDATAASTTGYTAGIRHNF